MQAHHYVSVSRRADRRGKITYSVRLKYFSGDSNSLDRTLQEETFRTKSAADNRANNLGRTFAARVYGVCGEG